MNTQDVRDNYEQYALIMNQKLEKMDTELQSLKKKALMATVEQKHQYQLMIDDLELKRDQMKHKLNELGARGEVAMTEMKSGIEQAWADLSSAFGKATSAF